MAMMTVPPGFDVAESDLTEVEVANDLRSVKEPEEQIMCAVARCQYRDEDAFAIKLALEEALTNAVKHGNRCDGSKRLVVRFSVTPQRTVVMVRDQGEGFVPDALPDPTAEENLELPNGRGIMLIRAYMTKTWFNDVGNEVWMLKENPAHPGQ